jgi:hypothetical protein
MSKLDEIFLDIEWLINQANKVDKYEKALRTISKESFDGIAREVAERALNE